MYLKKDNTKENIHKIILKNIKKIKLNKHIKTSINKLNQDKTGQGAAEYILLFGGVIVIALAGLFIYKSYFSNNASGLNATQDISSIRNNMTQI